MAALRARALVEPRERLLADPERDDPVLLLATDQATSLSCTRLYAQVIGGIRRPPDESSLAFSGVSRRVREVLEFKVGGKVVVQRDTTGRMTSAVLQRVKFLGERSANRNPDGSFNVYPLEARSKGNKHYDGAKVFVDHRRKPGEVRSVLEEFGWIEKPVAEGDGSFGDLHIIPTHPFAETAVWLAEHKPSLLGLSHHARCRGRIQGTDCVMESIDGVESVDVVSRGATTNGLFESLAEEDPMELKKAIAALLADKALSADEKLAKLGELLAAAGDEPATEGEKKPEPEGAKKPELVGAGATEHLRVLEGLRKEVDGLRLQAAARDRKDLVERMVAEAKLPAELVSEVFREQLLGAKDKAAIEALIADRRGAWGNATGGKTTARAPGPPAAGGGAPPTADKSPLESLGDLGRYGLKKKGI